MSTSILANLPDNFGKLHHSREKSPLRNTKNIPYTGLRQNISDLSPAAGAFSAGGTGLVLKTRTFAAISARWRAKQCLAACGLDGFGRLWTGVGPVFQVFKMISS